MNYDCVDEEVEEIFKGAEETNVYSSLVCTNTVTSSCLIPPIPV